MSMVMGSWPGSKLVLVRGEQASSHSQHNYLNYSLKERRGRGDDKHISNH